MSAFAVIVGVVLQIDIAILISGKILEAALFHFNMYVRARRQGKFYEFMDTWTP